MAKQEFWDIGSIHQRNECQCLCCSIDFAVQVFGAVYKSSPILVPGYGNSTSGRRKLSQLSGTPPLLGAPQLVGTPAEAPASELENGSFLLSYVRVTSPQLYSASLTFPQLQNGTISIQ